MSRSVLRGLTALALAAGTAVALPQTATAAPDGSGLVINEVYLNGGSSGAVYLNKYVELHNPTNEPINVAGWSVQYRSYSQTGDFSGVIPLGDHQVAPGGTFLVGGNANSTNGEPLPTVDAPSAVAFSGNDNGGTIALSKSATKLSGDVAAVRADANLVDLVGYGVSNTFETAPVSRGTAPDLTYSVTSSLNRVGGADTDDNATDFVPGAPSPEACGEACDLAPAPVETLPIAEIQGTEAESDLVGQTVTTTGVVTAVYATGGFNGAFIQTPATGGAVGAASHGLFVYGSAFARVVAPGDTLDVTGTVSEYNGMTQLEPTGWTPAQTSGTVTTTPVTFPMGESRREALEGMLVDATSGTYTLTNNYDTNRYGEISLAAGDSVLPQPTNEVRPGTSAYDDLVAENAARAITIDDGQSTNFTGGGKDVPGTWLTSTNEVRTGAGVTIDDDSLVLDYRNSAWKLQPRRPISAGDEPATISPQSTRETQPDDVGGAIKLASFNVLNYFTTTGEDWVAAGNTCSWYTDRSGTRITVNSCSDNGPRGAANDVSLARQQDKIVTALNALDADIVSLEEIEDTGSLGGADRDEALKTLVSALNAAAGSEKWAAVLSPTTVPESGRDVIRTAFIHQVDAVEPVGPSMILDSPAFANARAPLAQEFRPVGGNADADFVAIVNHFKSKGSGEGENADQGDGQGASNPARVAQAEALVEFVDTLQTGADTDRVFLLGDFNAYSKEDPLQVIEAAGFVNVAQTLTDEETYQFSGLHGSLDHVFASPAAFERVTGADVWTINAPESIGREYSRFNNNVTNLFEPGTPFRASDHDPVLVGYDPAGASVPTTTSVQVPSTVWIDEPVDVDVWVSAAQGSAQGTISVVVGDTEIAAGPVVDGEATVTVPANTLEAGRHTLEVAFTGADGFDDSVASTEITVRAATELIATAEPGTYGQPTPIRVEAAPGTGGFVHAAVGSRAIVASALMMDGKATVWVPGTALLPGSTPVRVFLADGANAEPRQTTVTLTIAKARAIISAKVLGKKVTKKGATVRVTLRTLGFTESKGVVRIHQGSRQIGDAKVRNGKATMRLKDLRGKGVQRLTVEYSGSNTTVPASGELRVRVL